MRIPADVRESAHSIGFGLSPLVDKPYQTQVMKARSGSRARSSRLREIRARFACIHTRTQRESVVINPAGPRQRWPLVINRSLTVSSSLTGYGIGSIHLDARSRSKKPRQKGWKEGDAPIDGIDHREISE